MAKASESTTPKNANVKARKSTATRTQTIQDDSKEEYGNLSYDNSTIGYQKNPIFSTCVSKGCARVGVFGYIDNENVLEVICSNIPLKAMFKCTCHNTFLLTSTEC